MYLATLRRGTAIHYQLRQSYPVAEDTFSWRVVYDLGADPRLWLTVIDDRVVLFDSRLVEAVAACTEEDEQVVLERLLWDFLPAQVRQRLERFTRPGNYRPGPLSDREKAQIARQVELFDRRRLYYLHYRAIDQSRLYRLSEKVCRPLLGQSRDEREFLFTDRERSIDPGHYLQYVFAIFDLQRHFRESFAPWLPEALARDEMAERLEQEICRLNRDHRFWQGEPPSAWLHRHLARYLIMFFDYRPAPRSFAEEMARAFMAGHRNFSWPKRRRVRSPEKIRRLFAASEDELRGMSREQLNRRYRQQAMQLHPDRGGDHELFIELTEVYRELLRGKGER